MKVTDATRHINEPGGASERLRLRLHEARAPAKRSWVLRGARFPGKGTNGQGGVTRKPRPRPRPRRGRGARRRHVCFNRGGSRGVPTPALHRRAPVTARSTTARDKEAPETKATQTERLPRGRGPETPALPEPRQASRRARSRGTRTGQRLAVLSLALPPGARQGQRVGHREEGPGRPEGARRVAEMPAGGVAEPGGRAPDHAACSVGGGRG